MSEEKTYPFYHNGTEWEFIKDDELARNLWDDFLGCWVETVFEDEISQNVLDAINERKLSPAHDLEFIGELVASYPNGWTCNECGDEFYGEMPGEAIEGTICQNCLDN